MLNPKGALFYLGIFTVVIAPGTSAGAMVLLVASMMTVSGAFCFIIPATAEIQCIPWGASWLTIFN